jgi:hypothetical protein
MFIAICLLAAAGVACGVYTIIELEKQYKIERANIRGDDDTA